MSSSTAVPSFPPKTITLPDGVFVVWGSKAAEAPKRAGGLPGWALATAWDQPLPSQIQVSFNSPLPFLPPNRTRFPTPGSKAITAPSRADGPAARVSMLQPFTASQVQVSFNQLVPLNPPNKTRLPEAGSKAIDANLRDEGAGLGGDWLRSDQFDSRPEGGPRDQVSSRFPVFDSAPPNRKMLPLTGLNAIAAAERTGGLPGSPFGVS